MQFDKLVKISATCNEYKEKILEFIQQGFIFGGVSYYTHLDSLQDDDMFLEGAQYLTFVLSKTKPDIYYKLSDFLDQKESKKKGKNIYNIQVDQKNLPNIKNLFCFTFQDYDNFENEKQLFRDLLLYQIRLRDK